ncbi:MAG: ATP-binding protein [Bacteroidales bacterium]|nr:ATP-binding protein [Bacteroidales bacterium]
MIFKNFRIRVILRIFLLAFLMFAFLFAIRQDKWYVTSSVLIILVIVFLIELLYFVETTSRELGKFLLSIKYKDFTNRWSNPKNTKASFYELRQAFNEIITEFQNVRIEKELQYQYLQMVFEHTGTAILCYEPEGKIQLINTAAKQLLELKKTKNLSDLESIDSGLYNSILTIKPNSEELIKIRINKNLLQLSLQCSVFKLQGKIYKMVSLHDIKNALDEQELDSWKKLIRVLNHEIMNSVTPISSLSTALNKMLINKEGEKIDFCELNPDDESDIFESLKTIENRSKGLLKFVTTYKQLTRLPNPKFTKVKIKGLLKHVSTLMKPELEKQSITLNIGNINDSLTINIDHEMIEQVLINLLLNSIDALKNATSKIINIELFTENKSTTIEVSDNGKGIEKDVLENIFVPFFTTKKSGSGIGLSLSRQIMRLHNGSISVVSKVGEGTTFVLKFGADTD